MSVSAHPVARGPRGRSGSKKGSYRQRLEASTARSLRNEMIGYEPVRIAVVLAVLGTAACIRSRAPGPALTPSSILLITVDTLRADRLGCYGDTRARTPHMDALARDGVAFEAAYTPVPITLPAHASLLTGLLPPAHGVRGNGAFALGPEPATLAEALRSRGLRTAAFVGGFPLARRFGLARGFDHYDDVMEKAAGVHYELAERRGEAVAAAARAWLSAQTGPVFVWVHLFDPHAPYDPPPPFRGEDAYRGEVAAADAAVGSLLSAWDARPEPTFVVLTSDHGEAFGEHREESHSLFVYDTTLRVPLVVRGPGLPAGRRLAAPVSIVDVAATIQQRLAGAGPPVPGRDLLAHPDAGPQPAALYAETLAPRLDFGWSDLRAWREGRYKYIRAPRPELYDILADPAETRDLVPLEPDVARRMASALEAALESTREAESRQAPGAEAAERLRALGYAQGPGGRGSGADPKDRVDVALKIARATGPFADFRQAARTYREIALLDPENPLVNFRLADALLRAGRPQDALGYYRKVLAAEPRTADPYVGLATAYAELGRLDESRRVLEEALGVEPANGQVHYNLGEIARVRGDRGGARARYEQALGDPLTRARAEARLRSLR